MVYSKGTYVRGKYKAKENGVHTAPYKCWISMLRRCYDKPFLEKWPTYEGCKVVEEWLDYQTFATWYNEQLGSGDKSWHLEKDIIKRDNKVYSKEFCALVPPEINTIFDKKKICRGKYPVGVTKIDNGYVSRVGTGGSRLYLGYYKTPEEAFVKHKEAKERILRDMANKWEGLIDPRVCQGLREWVVTEDG